MVSYVAFLRRILRTCPRPLGSRNRQVTDGKCAELLTLLGGSATKLVDQGRCASYGSWFPGWLVEVPSELDGCGGFVLFQDEVGGLV